MLFGNNRLLIVLCCMLQQKLNINSLSSSWGEICISSEKKKYKFPYHIPSGEIFNFDPPHLIRTKCLALVILTPIVSLIRSIYWLAKAAFLLLAAGFNYLDGQDLTNQSRKNIALNLADSVLAWTYGIQMTAYAAMGVILPNSGRIHYGYLERRLNRHVDGPHRDKFYLAICFQRLCVYDSTKIQDVNDKLYTYASRVEALVVAIKSRSYQRVMQEYKAIRMGAK